MKIRVLLFGLLFFPLSLGAAPLQDLLIQSARPLAQEAGEKTPIVFYLERPHARGQLARWDRQKKCFYLSKTALKKWFKQTQEPTPKLLARCLAPLYQHEKFHAENDLLAEQNGFIWPLTLGDEVLATAKQVAFMQQKTEEQPEYYKNCTFLTPALSTERKAAKQRNWPAFEVSVLTRYARLPAHKLPPPPLTPEFIRQAQTGKIVYGPLMYKVRAKGVTLQKVFSAGRPWTSVNTKELDKMTDFPFFKIYLKIFADQTNQTKRELFRR
ncbi:hypothetical protein [Candidatus Avelusimicrobium fimicolum]|uniref:hypothetical protein n=1 Tax=Candidatus Avelusimicrobium fimicolum TaxID=3416216 RepID=UPI003D1034BB